MQLRNVRRFFLQLFTGESFSFSLESPLAHNESRFGTYPLLVPHFGTISSLLFGHSAMKIFLFWYFRTNILFGRATVTRVPFRYRFTVAHGVRSSRIVFFRKDGYAWRPSKN